MMLKTRKSELSWWSKKIEEQSAMYVKLAKGMTIEEDLAIIMRASRRIAWDLDHPNGAALATLEGRDAK
jgi:hypothetical protein